jgi:hypothetical protein
MTTIFTLTTVFVASMDDAPGEDVLDIILDSTLPFATAVKARNEAQVQAEDH